MTKLQQAAWKLARKLDSSNMGVDEVDVLEITSELRKIEDAAYIKGYKACLKKQEMARHAANNADLDKNGLI